MSLGEVKSASCGWRKTLQIKAARSHVEMYAQIIGIRITEIHKNSQILLFAPKDTHSVLPIVCLYSLVFFSA